jgi:uncharacterized protein YdeI (YjbR/CyaY-like superfamily)
MTPVYFNDHKEFRMWLEKNHTIESELLAGYYKVSSGRPSMTWSQSVDEALCSKSGIYSFENDPTKLNKSFENIFKANKIAWEFFIRQAPSYQKTITHWISSAKMESTKLSRLNKTIIASEKHKRIF